jgi:hypothetical protein
VHFGRDFGHGLPHRTPWEEYEQIDRQVAEHQQSNSAASEDPSAKRHDMHHLREGCFVDFVGPFETWVGGWGMIRMHIGSNKRWSNPGSQALRQASPLGRRLAQAALTSARPGPVIRCIPLDHANEHIEQKLPLVRRERFKHAIVNRNILCPRARKKLFALGGELQKTRAPVGSVRAAIDEPFRVELYDELADMGGIDSEPDSKAVLIDARRAVLPI